MEYLDLIWGIIHREDIAMSDSTYRALCATPEVPKILQGELRLPKMDGTEISPGVFLIGEPSPRLDLGPNKMACLANYHGMLVLVELAIKFKE